MSVGMHERCASRPGVERGPNYQIGKHPVASRFLSVSALVRNS
jgi:hypothetical protein